MICTDRYAEIYGDDCDCITIRVSDEHVSFEQDGNTVILPRTSWRLLTRDVTSLIKLEGSK